MDSKSCRKQHEMTILSFPSLQIIDQQNDCHNQQLNNKNNNLYLASTSVYKNWGKNEDIEKYCLGGWKN